MNLNKINYSPYILYEYSLLSKANVLRENENKIGVYRWVNKIRNESYVGSSTNITKRLRKYYCVNYLESIIIIYNSRIYKALLNYGGALILTW